MPSSVIAYTGNDVAINNILLNTIDADCIWTVSDIDGWWGLPEATAPDSPRSVYEDGSTPVAGRYLSRKLKLTGTIVPTEPNGGGQAFSVAARNAFNRALNLIRTQGILQVNGDPAKMTNVQVVDRPLMNMSKQNDVLTFEISLRASDPRKYDISQTTLFTTAYLGNVGRTYDKVYDYTYGAAGSSGLINAYNEGTYNTFGKIVINGPVINPVIEHLNSDAHLAFDIDLAIGQSLEIDLAVHTVTLNGGANRRTSLLPISKWFSLMPGDNFIKFSGTQNPLPQHATDDRTNLIIAPNATSGTTQGWQMRVGGDALAVTTFPGVPGNNIYLANSAVNYTNSNWGFETATTARPPVTAFDFYAFSLDIRQRNATGDPNAASSPTLMSANISFYDFNSNLIRTHESTAYAIPGDRWVRIASVAQAPSGAVKASVFVRPSQYQHDLANATHSQGYYFDNVLLEKVFTQDDLRKQIASNGNLTQSAANWSRTDPSQPAIDIYDRTWFPLDGNPTTSREMELDVSDFYVRTFNDRSSAINRYGYQYIISSGFEVGEEYTFAGDVRSTIDQNWAVKVQALTSGGIAITGTDGSKYITQGTSVYVGANEWLRLSSTAAVPSGTASLRVLLEPANGAIYAVNAVANPGFERVAVDEVTMSALTMSDSFGQYTYGEELVKNWAMYPDTKGIGSFPNYWSVGSFGTAGAGTITSVSTGGYLNGYAARKAWTTAPSTPATQADLGILHTITPSQTSFGGAPISVRAWVTASKTSNQQIAIEFINAASATVSTWVSPAVSIGTGGGWIIAENIPNSALNWVTLRLHIGPYAAGFTPAIADYITASALMIEFGPTSHIYFSGSSVDAWDKRYDYDSLPGGPSSIHSTAQTKYRENLAYNPRPFGSATYWSYQNGTTGASTGSTVTNEVGPTDQYGFRRATITTADTGGNSGHLYRQDSTFAGLAGDKHVSSMWVRASAAYTVSPQVAYRLAGATVGSATTGGSVAIPANVWTRISVASTATGAYDGMQLLALDTVAGPAIGTTIDATGVLIERDSKIDVITNLVNDPSFEVAGSGTIAATNMFIDPEALTLSQFESNTGSAIDLSNISGFALSPSATRGTRVTTAAGRMGILLGAVLPTSTQYTLLLTVRASTLLTNVVVNYRPTISSSGNQVSWGTISIPAGVSQVRITGNTNASAPSSTAGITFVWSSGSVASTLDMTDVVVVQGTYLGPYFDGDNAPITASNLAINPSMESASGTVEVRRNLATDPAAIIGSLTGSNLAGWEARWYGSGSGAGVTTLVTGATDGPVSGLTTFMRKTWTVSPTGMGDTGFSNTRGTGPSSGPATEGIIVVPGITYTFSTYMRPSVVRGGNFNVQVYWRTSAGTYLSTNTGTNVAPIAGQWVRVSLTVAAPATAERACVLTDFDGGASNIWQPGDTLDGTGLLCEVASGVLPYFDGTIQDTPDTDLTSAWTGTVNASQPILTASAVTGYSPAFPERARRYQSTQWSSTGTKSIRVTPLTSISYAEVALSGLTIGQTYTVAYKRRTTAVLSGASDVNYAGRFVVVSPNPISNTMTTVPPNTPGVFDVVGSFVAAATTHGLRLGHGYTSGEAWFDDLVVVPGVYTGGYFDGNNTTAGLATRWTGAPDASVSYLYSTTYYDPAWTTAWTGTVKASTSTVNVSGVNAVTSSSNVNVIHSGDWTAAGTRSLRLVPNSASTDTYAVIGVDAAARVLASIASNKLNSIYDNVYTVRAVLRRSVDATSPFNSRSSNVYIITTRAVTGATQYVDELFTQSGSPDDAGVSVVSRTFNFWDDVTSMEFRVYNGTSVGKGDLWIDAFAVVAGPTAQYSDPIQYFDGSTAPADGYNYAWTGGANASPSTRFLLVSPTLQPYFDGDTSDTKELYRNFVLYPNPNSVATGWSIQAGTGGAGSVAFNAGAGVAANGFVRATWTTGTTAPSTGGVYSGAGQTNKPVPASTVLSAGMWVRPSVDLNFYLQTNFYTTAAAYISSPPLGPTTFCPANKWTLVKAENFTSPANAYSAVIYAMVSSNVATGTTIDVDQAMIVNSPTLPAYFDGNISNVQGAGGSWLGTAFASQSVLRGVGDANFWWNTGSPSTESSVMTYPVTSIRADWLKTKGLLAVGSTEYQQNAHQGSLRLTPTSDSNDSYVDLFTDDEIVPTTGGKSYTLFATVVVDKVQSGSLSPSARRFVWMSESDADGALPAIPLAISDAIPNVAGRYTFKWTAASVTGLFNHIRFYNGASKGNGDIWLERFSVVSGDSYESADPYYATNMGNEFYQGSETLPTTFINRTGISEVYRNNVENPEFRYLGAREPNVTRINMLTDPRGTVNTFSNENGWTAPTLDLGSSLVLSAQKADGPEGRQEFWRLTNTPGVDPQLLRSNFIIPSTVLVNQTFKIGDIYTFSMWVRAAQGGPMSLRATLSGQSSNNTQITSDVQVLVPNTWTRLFVTFLVEEPFTTVPELPTIFRGELLIDGSSNTSAQIYDYGSAMLEKTDKLLPYFDGGMETNVSYIRGYQGSVTGSPSIEVQSGIATLRQNLHLSPTTNGQIGDAAETTQWEMSSAGGGTGGFVPPSGLFTDWMYSFSVGATGTSSVVISTRKSSASAIPITPFTEYAYSVDIGSSTLLPTGSRADIQWLDKNNNVLSTAVGATTAVTSNTTYQRRSITAVSPSGAVFARPLVTFPSAGTAVTIGTRLGGTNALFEKANYVDTFFSGSAAISGSLNTVAWNGVRNSSSSSLIDSRLAAVRTNYATEAVPLALISPRWSFTPGAGVYNKTWHSTAGPNEVPGMLGAQVTTSPAFVPYVWAYSDRVSGIAGDTYTGSMWYRITAGNPTGDINATLTYKLLGSVVNSASAVMNTNYSVWRHVYTPAVAAAGTFDEIVISLTTALGNNVVDVSYVTQALIEKTTQQLSWFNAQYPGVTYTRKNFMANPSFEAAQIALGSTIDNRAANSGPFGTLTGTGTWAALPPLGATVNTQMIQSAGDTHPHAAPNYVRSIYATAATVTGDKGTEYVNGYGSAQFGTGAFYVEMYVRSSVALPARLLITSETGVSTVVSTSVANTGINLVPNQWTRLYGSVTAPGTHTKVRVKALLGSASTSLPVGTVFDTSSVLITSNATGYVREYNDKNLPDADFRDYSANLTHTQASLYRNPYIMRLKKNLVLDPTIQYGGNDWMLTPGWGTGGNGTRTIELGRGLAGGYSEMRRWTVTPSNSTSVSGVGAGYLFKAGVTGRPYSFTALYSASKASSASAWVTWYTDATLSTVVSSTLLSSVAYEVSGVSVFLTGQGAIAPATAGFGLFTVGAWNSGFNPVAGDWMSVSNMRIDEGTYLVGTYFDVNSFSGTDLRYQVEDIPGTSATYEIGSAPRSVQWWSASTTNDKSWAQSGQRSIRIVPTSTTSNSSSVELLDSGSSGRAIESAPYARTFTASGTIRVGPDGHRGAMHIGARTIAIAYNSTTIYSATASASANNVERLSVTATVPANATNVIVYLYNGGYAGAGDIWFDDVMLEETSTVNDYFDGNSTDVPAGQTAAWLGTPSQSYSVIKLISEDYVGASSPLGSHLVGAKPYTVEPFDGFAATQILRGAAASPSSFIRVANYANSSNDVFATVGGSIGGMRLGMQAGRTYTALGTVMLETVQTGTLHANARRLAVLYKTASTPGSYQSFVSSQAPNATGSYSLRNIFTLPTDTTEAFLALYSGSANGEDRLYWTNVALVPYTYTGPYFDGQSAAWNAGETPAWASAVDASATTVTGTYPARVYAYNSRVIQSPSWAASDANSLKIIPISTENSYAVVRDELTNNQWGSPYLPVTATTARVVKATVYIKDTQAGTLSPYARSVVAVNSTTGAVTALAQAPNVPGVYELTATLPGNYALQEIRLYNGSTGVSGTPIWWDNFGVFYVPEGITVPGTPAYSGPYFDGSTPGVDGVSYTWIDDNSNSASMASVPGAGIYWPQDAIYYADKISAISGAVSGRSNITFFDGRTPASSDEVYYYTGNDEASITYARTTKKPAVDTYFDGNTAGAVWNGVANGSTSTLPGLPEIPEAVMVITYRSAWIE